MNRESTTPSNEPEYLEIPWVVCVTSRKPSVTSFLATSGLILLDVMESVISLLVLPVRKVTGLLQATPEGNKGGRV